MNFAILAGVIVTGAFLIWPRIARAVLWRATVTPLASIIGSGFLVLGPILVINFGSMAPIVMIGLCLVAYLFGSAIRFNITWIEQNPDRGRYAESIERFASMVLVFAYVISVAYYLNLFGSFGVRLTAFNDPYHARLLTSGVFLVILITGWTRGFSALERMEQISVGLKLAIIAGLLVGLALHFLQKATVGELLLNEPQLSGWSAITLSAGLIITVQGFETSRYLSEAYSAEIRNRSMKIAQGVSALIYLLYLSLLSFAFDAAAMTLSETAIIDLMEVVAPVLSALLIVAALSAQFSAAVADTSGTGGLISELSHGRLSSRVAYVILVAVGLTLTWTANIFEIISYASRAFAAYYTLQAALATLGSWGQGDKLSTLKYALITLIAFFAAIFGTAVE